MNLTNLFAAQKELRDHINYTGEDRFEKLILALLVEIGECANEWRGFKFWSTDQKPRTSTEDKCLWCDGKGLQEDRGEENCWYECHWCDGRGNVESDKNPLLEEYVDGLHFVLDIGLEHGIEEWLEILEIEKLETSNITNQFTMLFQTDWHIYEEGDGGYYHEGLELYLGLGEMLGFTWEQIEQAYFDKNAVNHQRQENGY